MDPVRHSPDDATLEAVLRLLRSGFAYMDSRIDPPSSIHRLDLAGIRRQCGTGEVWSLGDPPVACVFLTPLEGALYLGKLVVAEGCRGQGLARRLIALAEDRARALDVETLELKARVELVENHRAFARLGFERAGEGAHAGYDRPTWIVMRKRVDVARTRR